MPHPKEIEPVHAEALAVRFARRILGVNHDAAHYAHLVTRNADGSIDVRFTHKMLATMDAVVVDRIMIPLSGDMAGIVVSSGGLRKESTT